MRLFTQQTLMSTSHGQELLRGPGSAAVSMADRASALKGEEGKSPGNK